MKTLHWLNKQIAYIMLFLSSQSGNGFTLLVVFLFDIALNAMGIQEFFATKMAVGISAAFRLSTAVANAIALVFSFFASSALGLSIMQATMNNKKITGFLLSVFSVIMTSFGLLRNSVSVSNWRELLTFDNIGLILIIVCITLVPPIVYAMNAGLVMGKFGKTLQRFNDASDREMEKSFNAQTKDLGEIDQLKTSKEVEKTKRKYKPIPTESGSLFDFDNPNFEN